ncbi:hypothetical protein ABZ816_29935 [Actinosynnema sp. NPDC047251]|uniref:Uncharacterized protein n=1 Tax=Saccharothrix espanaensis (strain ATCC 51144 / DSM 44229 / JCM 9112 / NBRC 15066 / NRRL 15764) TaxID=1179773 RepID=K0KD35_SACES|nr:hypothetical protein [Saccharothrix espanaensis]CCH34699.1 hypothetical protein BN6_74720 [Saccharothrix espanaensis DSM 44229]
MCVSSGPARFSGTTLYGGRCEHPEHGHIEVLGYQNTAVNLADGPNSMLLHLPATGMTRANFIPVGRHTDVLTRMANAAGPVAVAAAGSVAWMDAEPVEVFEHDVYTIVLAADPTRIPEALHQVPAHQRPTVSPGLFRFYADAFPRHTIALCCFDNAEAAQAKPLLLWYHPNDPDRIVLPALDSHTGGVPDLDAPVQTAHQVLLGTPNGFPVTYGPGMRHKLRTFLPDAVIGVDSYDLLPNGDFAISVADLASLDTENFHDLGHALLHRVRP